jgi:phage terminase large subunit-like protein
VVAAEVSVLDATMPRIMYAPDYGSSAGAEAIELAAMAGLVLDPWEQLVLETALGEGDDGRWAAAEVGLCVPRQNGKNAVLEARELAALFLLRERLVIHSAQQFKTAKEHFQRLLARIESTPDFDRRVRKVIRTHGEEGIELRNGQRVLFFARTKAAGRGFSEAELIVLDEAMFLAETSMGALVFTQAAAQNRQRWYTGSAVDELVHPDGVVFARVRERALAGNDPRLAYFEWSADCDRPELLEPDLLGDEDTWAAANPALDIRISREAVRDELRSLDRRTFAVERLGVGAWPATDAGREEVIPAEKWLALTDEEGEITGSVVFAFDVSPDRGSAAIAVAGRRPDGHLQVEVSEHRRGAAWVVPELVQKRARWDPIAVMADAAGPAGSLVFRCEEAGFSVDVVTAADHARACGLLVDLVDQAELRHLGSGELASALRGATQRPLGDAWAWSRKNSTVDITPLVAATLALWGAATLGWDPTESPVIF